MKRSLMAMSIVYFINLNVLYLGHNLLQQSELHLG